MFPLYKVSATEVIYEGKVRTTTRVVKAMKAYNKEQDRSQAIPVPSWAVTSTPCVSIIRRHSPWPLEAARWKLKRRKKFTSHLVVMTTSLYQYNWYFYIIGERVTRRRTSKVCHKFIKTYIHNNKHFHTPLESCTHNLLVCGGSVVKDAELVNLKSAGQWLKLKLSATFSSHIISLIPVPMSFVIRLV